MDTVLPADVVEFCPHPEHQTILACGTYKIECLDAAFTHAESEIGQNDASPKQRRHGTCLIFETTSNTAREGDQMLQKLQEIPLPAVLDLKWCHRTSTVTPIMAIADSEGHITLQEWSDNDRQMHPINSITCASSDVLCLSLDWSNRRSPTSNLGLLAVSLSNGSLCLLRPADQMGLLMTETWTAHEYESWIAAWDYWNTNIIYSGGDDLKLKGWDIRQGFTHPTFVNKRFEGGVTTIQSHPNVEYCIAVGSYDNSVRLFDSRKPLVPLTQVDTGGGAWRVKWHPSIDRKDDLLVACMHDGFKIVHFDGERLMSESRNEGEIVRHFTAHKSLAYGVDWSFADSKDSQTLIASCSFYDHALYTWYG